MKKIIYIALLSLTFSYGCSDWLDVNTDPNNLSELPNSNVLVPIAEMSIANTIMGWEMGFAGGYWSQYMAQNYTASQFKFLEEYSETEFSTAYSELTAGTLNDLKKIQTIAIEKGDDGSYLLSEVLSIYVWQIMTDTWGDIPYFEALQGNEKLSPNFDKGQVIYADLMKRINALLAKDFSKAMIYEKSDFLLGGDVEKWIAFANTLKLKLMLRLSETSEYNNVDVLNFVKSATFISESVKIKGDEYFDEKNGKRHPMAEFELDKANYLSTNVIASKTLLDYLAENEDPRIDSIYKKPSSGVHQGAFQGDFDSTEDSDGDGTKDESESYSSMSFDDNMDIPLMSLWEVEFYIAEVYARAGDHVNAKLHYENGVNASFAAHSLTNTITTAGGYAVWVDGTVEEEIHQIAMQKWVSYAKYQHWEAFLERNRTKYPSVNNIDIAANRKYAYANFPLGQFTISVKGRAKLQGNLPASPIYPNDVLTRNTSSTKPSQKPNVGVKIWWDQKAGK
jgi:hypothetical protein